jgi:hypothetical protein
MASRCQEKPTYTLPLFIHPVGFTSPGEGEFPLFLGRAFILRFTILRKGDLRFKDVLQHLETLSNCSTGAFRIREQLARMLRVQNLAGADRDAARVLARVRRLPQSLEIRQPTDPIQNEVKAE